MAESGIVSGADLCLDFIVEFELDLGVDPVVEFGNRCVRASGIKSAFKFSIDFGNNF